MLERSFRKKAMDKINSLPNTWFESIQQVSIRGTPDVIGCVNGTFVALEFKKNITAKRSQMQMYKGDCIKKSKGVHFFIYPENFEDVYSELSKMAQFS